jgi:multiple sugar transport system permease protein
MTFYQRQALWGLGFAAPALVLFVGIVVYPVLWAGWLSLHDYSLVGRKAFVGLGNYASLWDDPLFWKSLRNTVVWAAGVVPSVLFSGLLLALALNLPWLRLRSAFRAAYFAPVVTNVVAAAFVWRWLLDPQLGAVNYVLALAGVRGPAWLADPQWALPAMMAVGVWKQVGLAMVMFLAGLQTIPQEFTEAAQIDGASAWQAFWRVTLPLLNPTLVFVVVTLMINALRVFTIPYVMSAGGLQWQSPGGPLDSTRVFVLHIYDTAFVRFQMGYASANAMVLMSLVVILTLLQMRLLQRPFEY